MMPSAPDSTTQPLVSRVRAWHLAVLFLLLSLPGLGSMPLFEPDEGRYAEIPREMLATGDFVTPHLNGVFYFEKPALYYWLAAGSQVLLGRTELAARAISLLAALLGVLLTFDLGRFLADRRVGIYAALILCLSPAWLVFARINTLDMTVSVAIAATLAAFWRAQGDDVKRRAPAWYALFAASAVAVLTKGLIGMVLPGAVIFVYLVLSRRWAVLLRVPWISGTLLFAVIAVPWHLLIAQRNADFLWFYFVREHFLRYTTDIADRSGPFYYYLPVLLIGFLPWSGLLPAAGWLGRLVRDPKKRSGLLFLAVWLGVIFAFFSASSSKLIPYLLPVWPAAAVLLALVLVEAEREPGRLRTWAIRGMLASTALLMVLLAAFAWVAAGRVQGLLPPETSTKPLLLIVALHGLAAAVAALVLLARGRLIRGLLCLLPTVALFMACLVLGAFEVADGRSAESLARCIEDRESSQVAESPSIVSYRAYVQTLPFYLGQRIQVAEFEGELEFGISKLDEREREAWYPSLEQLQQRWNSPSPMYMVTERRYLSSMAERGLEAGTLLAEKRKLVLLTNQPSSGPEPASCSE